MFSQIPLFLAQEGMTPASGGGISSSSDGGVATSSAPAGTATTQAPPGAAPQGGGQMFLILIAVMVFMIIFSMRSQSKEKKKRAALLASIGKGDRVQTVGGIVGTVVEVRENELVLKVDENNNTRIKFTRGAIQTKLEEKES